MPTDVVMPQMGESIAEGTIVRWIKKVGDAVERDEPLFEISTDKVDAEIPSPVAGVVTEIRAKEGETVPVNSVVAVIGPAKGATSSMKASSAAAPVPRRPSAEVPRPNSAPAKEVEAGQTRRHAQAQVRPEPVAKPEGRAGSASPEDGRVRLAGGENPAAFVAARQEDCEGTRRRHFADARHRHRGTCHEERHSWVHRRGRRIRTAFTSGRGAGGPFRSRPSSTGRPERCRREARSGRRLLPGRLDRGRRMAQGWSARSCRCR